MMDDDTKQELQDIQDIAVRHAIAEMKKADGYSLESREDRGDRGFLTGMAAKSVGVAVRIEQMMMLMERNAAERPNDPTIHDAHDRLVRQARGEVQAVLERVGAKGKRDD